MIVYIRGYNKSKDGGVYCFQFLKKGGGLVIIVIELLLVLLWGKSYVMTFPVLFFDIT